MIKPILFNTDMVRAILDNRKTTTRRPAKGIHSYSEYGALWTYIKGQPIAPISKEKIIELKAPYKPGDILYVRETWQFVPCIECNIECEKCGKEPITYEDRIVGKQGEKMNRKKQQNSLGRNDAGRQRTLTGGVSK